MFSLTFYRGGRTANPLPSRDLTDPPGARDRTGWKYKREDDDDDPQDRQPAAHHARPPRGCRGTAESRCSRSTRRTARPDRQPQAHHPLEIPVTAGAAYERAIRYARRRKTLTRARAPSRHPPRSRAPTMHRAGSPCALSSSVRLQPAQSEGTRSRAHRQILHRRERRLRRGRGRAETDKLVLDIIKGIPFADFELSAPRSR